MTKGPTNATSTQEEGRIIANVTLNIPNQTLALYAAFKGYQATVDDPANPGTQIPNPVPVLGFVKQALAEEIKTGALTANRNQKMAELAVPTGLDVT